MGFSLNQKWLILERHFFRKWNSDTVSIAVLQLPKERYKCPEVSKSICPLWTLGEGSGTSFSRALNSGSYRASHRNCHKKALPYCFLRWLSEENNVVIRTLMGVPCIAFLCHFCHHSPDFLKLSSWNHLIITVFTF